MMKQNFSFLSIAILITSLSGCSILPEKNASWNKKSSNNDIENPKANFDISPRGKFSQTLFIVSSSGGGSRAAYLTGSVLLKLQKTDISDSNLLSEVDAISAVSGGTLPAAYYSISEIPGENNCIEKTRGLTASPRPDWSPETVREKMATNFQRQWLLRWFLPHNIVRFWFTSFDRSDIMTQVFANSLYDRQWAPGAYTFGEICGDRPNLIINATRTNRKTFGNSFTFTEKSFSEIGSDIYDYPIANAVMSSAAFPAAFNYTTLTNYATENENIDRYIHLFDGGNHDNLGLESTIQLINKNSDKFNNIVVLLIDAYINPTGAQGNDPEPRDSFDYLIDTNFFDSYDALLATKRKSTILKLQKLLESLEKTKYKNTFFYHLTFENLPDTVLKEKLGTIKTAFKIKKGHSFLNNDCYSETRDNVQNDCETEAIDKAVDLFFEESNDSMQQLKSTITRSEISMP